jgi:hypothetical protein
MRPAGIWADAGLLLVGQLVGHRGCDEARRDAVDGDAAGGDLGGEAFDMPIMPALEAA